MDILTLSSSLLVLLILCWFIFKYFNKSHSRDDSFSKVTLNQYGTVQHTQTGFQVKSNAERRIADYLTTKNITYIYESQLDIDVGRRRYISRSIKPDFYLPDYDAYIEYWGLVDLEDGYLKEDYIRKMKWKMAQYYKNNIKFISIYPYNFNNFDYVFSKKFEEITGKKLPN